MARKKIHTGARNVPVRVVDAVADGMLHHPDFSLHSICIVHGNGSRQFIALPKICLVVDYGGPSQMLLEVMCVEIAKMMKGYNGCDVRRDEKRCFVVTNHGSHRHAKDALLRIELNHEKTVCGVLGRNPNS